MEKTVSGANTILRPETIQDQWGVIGILHPPDANREGGYILVLPGFTGDALSHIKFIQEAQSHGFGVVALTPRWVNSVRDMVNYLREAVYHLSNLVNPKLVQVVRANSFGAYLAIQILDINPHIDTAIFVTPCSATQLADTGKLMGWQIVSDYSVLPQRKVDRGIIYVLDNDNTVPTLDPYFERAIRSSTISRFSGNHLTAGDADECCTGALNWLTGFKSK